LERKTNTQTEYEPNFPADEPVFLLTRCPSNGNYVSGTTRQALHVASAREFIFWTPGYPVKLSHWESAMGIRNYTVVPTVALALGLFFTTPVSIAIDAMINMV